MKRYTVGIYFDKELTKIALILKNRPAWQNGLYNFIGGTIEDGENGLECIVREFEEECGVYVSPDDWVNIGLIRNKNNYEVELFSALQEDYHKEIKTMEDQEVGWFELDNLPKNMISNLFWLIPFAVNCWTQGNADYLNFGTFEYR